MDLYNKVVLVTGSSSGIGKATAIKFAQKGCSVIITYNQGKKNGEKVLETCRKYGNALLIHLDVTNDHSIEQAVEQIIQKWGKIDILVNNAGIVVGNLLIGQSTKDIEDQININLSGLIKVTRAFLPHLSDQEGLIINIASGAAKAPSPGLTVYCATKFGVRGFTQSLAKELPPGIRTYCVNPRITATRVTNYEGRDPAAVADIIVQTAEEKFGKESGDDIDVLDFFIDKHLKSSHYNLFFPFGDKYILFNTVEESVLEIDSELKELLEKNEILSIDREYRKMLKENEMIIKDKKKEMEKVRQFYSSRNETSTDFSIITTYLCNLSCTYCKKGMDNHTMDKKTAACIMKFIKEQTVTNNSKTVGIELCGGEPLLNMPVNLLIANELRKWCQETGREFSLSVVTNGTLLTQENVDALTEYNCRFLVTVDGGKEIHDQRRRYKNGKGTFDDILEGLHRINQEQTTLQINVDNTNKDIVSFLEFLKNNNLQKVKISIRSFNTSACRQHGYCMPDEPGSKLQNYFSTVARAMGFDVVGEKLSPLGSCFAERGSYFVVDPYLRLFKCPLLLLEKNLVGVIQENSKPVFNQVYEDFLSRDPLTLDQCCTCELVPVCGGGCPVEVFETMGTTHGCVCRKSELYNVLKENLQDLVRRS